MSEQARLVSVEIESEPTLFPQFSPARFVGEKRSEPWKRVSFEPGSWGGGRGGTPLWNRKQKKTTKSSFVFRIRIISRADGLQVGFLKARFRFLLVGRSAYSQSTYSKSSLSRTRDESTTFNGP